MDKLIDINNYIVYHNGTIESHEGNEVIIEDINKITVNQDTSLQIKYLIDQEGSYNFNLTFNKKVNLIEIYDFKEKATLQKNIEVKENSDLLRYSSNNTNILTDVIIEENVNVGRYSNVKCAYVELADANIKMNINYDLNDVEANASLRLATLAKGKEKKNITLSLTHYAPYTTGIMDNYGVVKDQSNMVIDGIGTIKKGNHGSNSHQTNKIIVFDEACVAKANPYLYIDEYDVKASHGASVGKIDEEHLYYLQSRGLTREDAMQLVTYGYFIPVLEFIENKQLKELFNETLKEKVGF